MFFYKVNTNGEGFCYVMVASDWYVSVYVRAVENSKL